VSPDQQSAESVGLAGHADVAPHFNIFSLPEDPGQTSHLQTIISPHIPENFIFDFFQDRFSISEFHQ
jgi:hypothetical protein